MEEHNKDVPYIVYESESARHERTVWRLLKVILVLIACLVVSNLAWLWVWNQYDFCSETYSVENDGNSNLLGAGASMNGVSNGIENSVQEKDSN